jgi:hypothetical protein
MRLHQTHGAGRRYRIFKSTPILGVEEVTVRSQIGHSAVKRKAAHGAAPQQPLRVKMFTAGLWIPWRLLKTRSRNWIRRRRILN